MPPPNGKEAPTPIAERLADPGYTPRFRDLSRVVELMGTDDDDQARDAERAILRIDSSRTAEIVDRLIVALKEAQRPLRGRLARLLGRILERATGESAARLLSALRESLFDSDPKTRRAAARALGKATLQENERAVVETAMLKAWDEAESDDDRRALAEALGKLGSDAAKSRISALAHGGEKEARVAARAAVMIERTAARASGGGIAVAKSPAAPLPVRFHTRRGLEAIVLSELDASFAGTTGGPGVVNGILSGTLSSALAVRSALNVSFPIALARSGRDLAETVANALTSENAMSILRSFTTSTPIRFRLAWASGGHRRSLTWKCAEMIHARTSELVNDPRASTWEVVVDDANGQVAIELVPRDFVDDRFAYRTKTVPASSHPVIAAAIARIAPRRSDDVVWDPFVGAGAELVERAKLGPYAELHGTDTTEDAISAARINLEAAGITSATLTLGDATAHVPPRAPTLILTNPPMGRRVERGSHQDLLERFVVHAAKVLAPGGSLVWTAPEPRRIQAAAERAGLVLERSILVDMGGFDAALSVHRRA